VLPCLIAGVGVILYGALLAVETHYAHEPHLWRDIWEDAWSTPDDFTELVVTAAFFFEGLALLGCSLPAFAHSSPPVHKCVLLAVGLAAVAFGAFSAMEALFDFPTDYSFAAGGQGVLIFGALYGSAVLVLVRSLPAIPFLFKRGVRLYHRLSILAVCLWLFAGLAIGALGSGYSIELYVVYDYHSG
jgi:hypothetical protein